MMHRRRPRGLYRSAAAALASTLLAAGLAAAGPAASANPGSHVTGDAAVEQQVRAELVAEGTTTYWVYLRDQADLTAAAGIADRGAQGRFVYEQLTGTAQASQAGLVTMLATEGADYQSYWIANAVRVTSGAELLERIAARPEVEQVTADRVYEVPEPAPASEQAQVDEVEWNVDRVNAPQVWDEFGATGEDIVVGTIDSGVEFDHPALVEQYRGNLGDGQFDHDYQWHDPSQVCGSPSLVPCDNTGHGTHVTGTIVGDDGAGNRIGVAPGAQWIAAKGCETNSCSQGALLSSGQFMLAPTDLDGDNEDPERRPHVVNNSWGGGATDDPWYRPTVEAWVAAGIFPQFAIGNTQPGTAPCESASNPGNLPESYAAGAFDIDNQVAGFSNRGPSAFDSDLVKPNIAAPGVAVRSSMPGGAYAAHNGTSMASPHVAGAVALMWSAAPVLARDIVATRELLDLTAIDVEDLTCGGTPDDNNVWGQGRLDAFAAVEEAPRGPTGTLTGVVTDAGTDAPIAGATVTATGEVERQRTTGADGTYQMVLPVGEYEVTASAFAYEPQTALVSIVEDQTTTEDFPLAAPAGAQLSVSPGSLDFGAVPVGSTSDPLSLTLTSIGAEPVTVDEVAVAGSGFAPAGGTCGDVPITLDHLATCTLDVSFSPETPGPAEGTVTLTGDAGDSPHTVTLQGHGHGIVLSVEGRRDQGTHMVDLSWEGAASAEVDIHRDGELIATVANDGSHTDPIGPRGPGAYAYLVCEAGTAECSNVEMAWFGGPPPSPPEFHFCDIVSTVPDEECRALVAIYETNGGSDWGLGGWLEDPDPCTWASVQCATRDGQTHVHRLQFLFTPFTGDLAPEVGDLSQLEILEILFNGGLTGLPDEIGNLGNLERLAVGFGQLGSVPATIGQLSSLTSLELSENLLSSLPEEIGELDSLERLQAVSNQLEALPDTIGDLAALEALSLQVNQISELPGSFAGLSNLRELDLSGNPLGGELPVALTQLEALRLLTVTDAGLTGIPAEISDLADLVELQLAFNEIGELPVSLSQLSGLQLLGMSGNQLTEVPTWVGDLPNLLFLRLADNLLTEVPDELSALTQLEVFDAAGNQLTGAIPDWLGTFSDMYTLLLADNDLSGEVPVGLRDGTSIGGPFSLLGLSGNGCLTSTVDPTFTQWLDDNAAGWDDGCAT